MIIKVKTGGKVIPKLKKYLVKKGSNKTTYKIPCDKLLRVLAMLYDLGIKGVSVHMDEKDDAALDTLIVSKNEYVSVKDLNSLEFLEEIFNKQLPKLKKEKNIDTFFKFIDFKDEGQIYKKMYESLTKITKEELHNCAVQNGSKDCIFRIVFCDLYKAGCNYTRSPEYGIMKEGLKKWLEEHHPEYQYCTGRVMSYSTFLKFLLKHTGYDYF